jgi:hypothetical protein
MRTPTQFDRQVAVVAPAMQQMRPGRHMTILLDGMDEPAPRCPDLLRRIGDLDSSTARSQRRQEFTRSRGWLARRRQRQHLAIVDATATTRARY